MGSRGRLSSVEFHSAIIFRRSTHGRVGKNAYAHMGWVVARKCWDSCRFQIARKDFD
jgi:hypothetical protein